MKRETDGYRGRGREPGKGGGGEVAEDTGRISFGKQTFRSFKNSVFRLYFCGMVGFMAPMNMQLVARSLLLYRLTGSAAILGAMSLANAIPMLSLTLFGGVIADRVQKKYVMIAGQISSALVALSIALALTLGYLSPERAGSWWILVVNSVLQGTIMALVFPSRQAILREIVNEEELLNAASLGSLEMSSLRLLAPALAGFLVEAFAFAAVFYVMTGLYLISAVFIVLMPRTGTMTIRGHGAMADIKEGMSYIRHETTILLIIGFTLIAVILSMPYQMLLPIFTEDVLKVGAAGLGIIMSVSGIGAVFGSLVLASLPNKKRGLVMLASSLVLGVALVGFSLSSTWYLSLGTIVFVGLGQTGRMALGNALLQYYAKEEYLGRVMSLYMLEFGLSSFGTFAAGVLAQAMGVQWAVGSFATVLVLLSIMALVFVPRLRRLD